jgi:hypothetical protein
MDECIPAMPGPMWQRAFWTCVQAPNYAQRLKVASETGDLGTWTSTLTKAVVEACRTLGWHAAAKGHPLTLLPQVNHEYLSLDVMAFASTSSRWPMPVAGFELENSRDCDRIAYSLWKVLCVRSVLRVVFCYCPYADDGPALVTQLQTQVVGSLSVAERMKVEGQLLVVVGSRGEFQTFPYDYFRWWQLHHNSGAFRLM